MRETLECLLARTRNPERRERLLADLVVPPAPLALTYLWRTFSRLSSRRGSSGFGPSPIGWADIDAFVRLTQFALKPWEVEVIETLDTLFMAAFAKAKGPPGASEGKPS